MTASVLIVGAGPVGMTLASELARYGVHARIVDKAPHRTDKSKAMVLWSRTLELLDRGDGGAAPFVNAGFKIDGVVFMARDEVVGRVAMDMIPSTHNYALALPQSETERLLEERLASQGVFIERGVEVTMITPDACGADAVLRHPDGREEAVRADWLLGCDGAHSIVRHALNVPFEGETLLSDWFLADVHMTGYPRPDTDASVHWHKDGVLLIFPIQAGRYRVIGDLPATADKVPPTPTLAQVQQLVDRRGPAGTKLHDPVWLSGFRINGRKVTGYRHGHTFLAGDAAHIHSPAGGQGMNTGMQDAINLAWKLALVLRNEADESLLDTYSPERSAVGDEVLKAAERLTSVATLRNPIAQRLRNLAGHFALGFSHFTRGVAQTMSEVTVHYPHSPLNGPSVHGMKPGERVAPTSDHAPAGSGVRPVFALFAAPTAAVKQLINAYPGLLDNNVRPPLQADTISLVRPDGYLACSASEADTIAAYLDRLTARHGVPA
ncbi:FAD-dependent monooxygenase [Caballeronia sp. GAWG2-1]|uniref:FAD-dependent monooxygenase n=1 Tax=Caballeronia sp. GAWG2-1 TaxID=2921744 RepID=UPI0020297ACF|nr:FAD-dependent monooxygenase [Caballeronia sp. GAWG2-1]